MKSLPPLNALKSFEVAARTGSYVAASAELGVTPAAVSQQVRRLEDYLGRKLFVRLNNRVMLTDAGHAIYAGVTPAFDDIADLTSRVLGGAARGRLVVSALPSFADCWFMAGFEDFCAANPTLKIDLRIEDDPVDFARENIDLRLCYGTNLYPDLKTIALFTDEVVPLCSPAFLAAQPGGAIDLMALPTNLLIQTNWGSSFMSHPGWVDWFRHYCPARAGDFDAGHRVNRSRLALDFARRGLGIALGQVSLARTDLLAGSLVTASEGQLSLGHSYGLVLPHSKARRPPVARLVDWLCGRATDDRQMQGQDALHSKRSRN